MLDNQRRGKQKNYVKLTKGIQKELRNQLGIRVDYPVPGSGNNARKFFNNIEKVSEITQLGKNLLSKL